MHRFIPLVILFNVASGSSPNRSLQLSAPVLPTGCTDGGCQQCLKCKHFDAIEVFDYLNKAENDVRTVDLTFCRSKIYLRRSNFSEGLNLTSINLSFCNLIISSDDNIFENLVHLESLNLTVDHIRGPITNSTFGRLQKLKTLDLSYNDIRDFEDGALSSFPRLVNLVLEGNHLRENFSLTYTPPTMRTLNLRLSHVHDVTLGGNPLNVCHVDFSYTGAHDISFDSFNKFTCNNDSGLSLEFEGCTIGSISGSHDVMQKFKYLNFAHVTWGSKKEENLCNFTETLSNKNVAMLNLLSCGITTRNAECLTKLQMTDSLDLSANILGPTNSHWPVDIFGVAKIQSFRTLDLSKNMFQQPLMFSYMPNLTFLNLSNNEIAVANNSLNFFQNESSSLPNLIQLDLTNSFGKTYDVAKLTGRPLTWLRGLQNLEKLFLSDNDNLVSSGANFAGLLFNLTKLTHLWLTNTDFRKAALSPRDIEKFFKDQRNSISVLKLRRCRLNNTHLAMFKDLKNLTDLDLTSNSISQIQSNVFRGLSNLRTLHLAENKIYKVEPSVFDNLPNLALLTISDNAFLCTCEQDPFVSWLRKKHSPRKSSQGEVTVKDIYSTKCIGPDSTCDTQLTQYHSDFLKCGYNGVYVFSTLAVVLLAALVAVGCFLYRYRLDIRFCCLTMSQQSSKNSLRREPTELSERLFKRKETYQYDVFLCYDLTSQENEAFQNYVFTNLEDCHDFKFQVKWIAPDQSASTYEQIEKALENAHFIVHVVTDSFIENVWNDLESALNARPLPELSRERTILILTGGLKRNKLPTGLRRQSVEEACFEWPEIPMEDGEPVEMSAREKATLARDRRKFWKELKLLISQASATDSCCSCTGY